MEKVKLESPEEKKSEFQFPSTHSYDGQKFFFFFGESK